MMKGDQEAYSGEEGQDVLDKVSLVVVQFVFPIVTVHRKVDLFGCPER
jgi:hypothetical protein